MKKIIYSLLLSSLLLLNSNPVYANDFKGKNSKVYVSSDANQTSEGIKTTLIGSFIEDTNNNENVLLLSLKGFIPSNLIKSGGYYWGKLYWPSRYVVSIENLSSGDENVKIINSIPSNKIESVQVSETIGYTVGGNVTVTDGTPNANVNANYSVKNSISYNQDDFKTIQTRDGVKQVSWDIDFNSTRDGYTRDSYNAIYGNQLFMKSRLYNEGKDNFVDKNQLSPLISGGFSPNMVVAIKAPKDTKVSEIGLSYKRTTDIYGLTWSGTEWRGKNEPHQTYSTEHTYIIDWENHTIRRK